MRAPSVAMALLIFLSSIYVSATACQNLFYQVELHETKFELTPKQVLSPSALDVAPLDSTRAVKEQFRNILQNALLKFLPIASRFAVNLSHRNSIHLVSEGLTSTQHQQLLTFLRDSQVEQIFTGVPMLFRNHYFEVEVLSHRTNSILVDIQPKLAWDLKIQLVSQLISGFATKPTDKIRPYDPTKKSLSEKIRTDLLTPRFTQQTLATCSLASMIKVFKPRKINYSELELLNRIEANGIRGIEQIFGADPGLSLSQAAKLLQILGLQHGFRVTEVEVKSPEDVDAFAKMAALAAASRNTDVITNYYSPVVGRPGGGHFTPIAGYNFKTKEVLLGEVNLAMNPAFWTHEKILVEAMATKVKPEDPPRGYLVITWLDALQQ